jgi:molybdopterin/thiamine biosynthesis adenylyltransferase
MNTRKIKVVGAGGICSWLLEPLCRYLAYGEDFIEVTVIDGDTFEDRNRDRQRVSQAGVGMNKADYAVSWLKSEFSKIHFRAKPEYVTQSNVITLIRENDIVFMGVDNHATRKLVSDRCGELDNVVLISGGNDLTDGNVIIYIRKDGTNLTKPLTVLSRKIANPEDKNPGEFTNAERQSCQQEALANPQLVFTNFDVASIMLKCYYAYEQGKVWFEQVYTDIVTQRTRPSPDKIEE